eukprot:CCRYP_009280-RA/>CCRYP_009280-RA protein AED:0.38 eAED:0.38 QI:0/0/0/1/1/1/2/0/210
MVMTNTDFGTLQLTNKETSSKKWESSSFMDLYESLNCHDHAYDSNKPLFSADMWAVLKRKHASQAGMDLSLLQTDENQDVNYYAGYSEGKGRGIYAARDFLEGELVHDGSVGTAFWNDGMQWKKFVMSLPPPMPCDAMEWTWIQQVEDKGWLLCLTMGNASLMNHDDNFNTAPSHKRSLQLYAVRDIKMGEELTCDYGYFDTNWDLFGLA